MKLFLPFIILVMLFCNGCAFLEKLRIGSFHANKPVNYYLNHELAQNVSKVLILPVLNHTDSKYSEQNLYETLVLSLLNYKYFEVLRYTLLPSMNIEQLKKSYSLTLQPDKLKPFLLGLLDEIKVDAVLFSEVTYYKAYAPLVFGYKGFLYDSKSAELIWSVDDIFDMTDKNVKHLSKNWYYKKYQEEDNPSLKSDIMEISMRRFIDFSFSALFETWKHKQI